MNDDETTWPAPPPAAESPTVSRPDWAKPAAPNAPETATTAQWPPPAQPETADTAEWPKAQPEHPTAERDPIAKPEPRARIPLNVVRRTIAFLVVAAVAGFLGGQFGDGGRQAAEPRDSITPVVQGSVPAVAQSAGLDALYRQVSPSVVEIISGSRGEGTGSGVIVDAGGIVLTNNHVVSGSRVEVVLFDGRRLTGTVAGRDPQQDLAVVRINDAPQGLVAARLGNSDDVAPGQAVAAIGSPFGFQGSITTGVVSAVNRTFAGNSEYPPMRGLIQTDAAINPGNSGGPLFNLAGEVIGITTAIESPIRGSVGIGFAVPIKQAQRALPALVRGTDVRHPFLGIQGEASGAGGVEIVGITPGGSADAAGLRVGDVITSISGVPVGTIEEVAAQLERHGIGKRVVLTVRRGNDTLSISVVLRAYQGG